MEKEQAHGLGKSKKARATITVEFDMHESLMSDNFTRLEIAEIVSYRCANHASHTAHAAMGWVGEPWTVEWNDTH
jgi:hypothetical protein